MIVKTVNFLSRKRLHRNRVGMSENCRRIRQETGVGAIPSVCQRIKWYVLCLPILKEVEK
jgi:hypothetical protein